MNFSGSIVAVIIGLFSVMVPKQTWGQGCSDAGMCSIGSLNNSHADDHIYSSLSLNNVIGLGEAKGSLIYLHSIVLGAQIRVSKGSFFNLSLPLQSAIGDLGSTFALGDIAASFNINVLSDSQHKLILTLGGIIPTSGADLKENGRPLPMIYQSSLGTKDIIVGGSYFFKSWHVAIGFQHPFNKNDNGFLHSNWPENGNANNYFESNRFSRGDDLMVRIQKGFTKNKRTIFIGILPILRLQKDEIIKDDQTLKLSGSDQLTLNLNFGYLYRLNEKFHLRFTYANPVIWRKTRADGLTRPVVISGSIEYRL